jgi:hypothetical protein
MSMKVGASDASITMVAAILFAFGAVVSASSCGGDDSKSGGSAGAAGASSSTAASGSGGGGTGGGATGGSGGGSTTGSGGSAGSGGSNGCPASQPNAGTACDLDHPCTYANFTCDCVALQWTCAGGGTDGGGAQCPMDTPLPGDPCSPEGVMCNYDSGHTMCTCMADGWQCQASR